MDELRGVDDVDEEHAIKQADDKGKRQVAREPVNGVQDARMDQEVICGAEKGPRQREFRADETLNVAPLLAVVPQADMEALEGDETGEIFRHGHAHRHDQEQDHAIPERVADNTELLQRGDQVEKAQAAAVQRQIRPDAEAGIDPLPLRVRRGKEAAEQQLQHPAQRCTTRSVSSTSLYSVFVRNARGDDSACQKAPPGLFCQAASRIAKYNFAVSYFAILPLRRVMERERTP